MDNHFNLNYQIHKRLNSIGNLASGVGQTQQCGGLNLMSIGHKHLKTLTVFVGDQNK